MTEFFVPQQTYKMRLEVLARTIFYTYVVVMALDGLTTYWVLGVEKAGTEANPFIAGVIDRFGIGWAMLGKVCVGVVCGWTLSRRSAKGYVFPFGLRRLLRRYERYEVQPTALRLLRLGWRAFRRWLDRNGVAICCLIGVSSTLMVVGGNITQLLIYRQLGV